MKWGWFYLEHEIDCPIFWGNISYAEESMGRQYFDDFETMKLLDNHPYVVVV